MKNERRSYKVTIFGDEYALMSDELEEHMAQAASLVDVAMREIDQSARIGNSKKVAVLAAMRIASKLLHLQRDVEKNKQREYELASRIEEDILSLVP
jgi:cell division protein ZapA (FtsZ GTPase activity inhibitor)